MNIIDFDDLGITPLSESEMIETDGGFLPLLIVGAALLLASCSSNNNQTNGGVNTGVQVNIKCDSCKTITVNVYSKDSVTVTK